MPLMRKSLCLGYMFAISFCSYGMMTDGQPVCRHADEMEEKTICIKEPMAADGIIRLSRVEVHPQYLDEYLKYASEVGEVSLLTEPGVLTMYAVSEKGRPNVVTILETYASKAAYEKHIASPHFRKYKQGTLHMVKSLQLLDQTPVNPASRITNFIQERHTIQE